MHIDKPFVEWSEEDRDKYLSTQYKLFRESGDRFNAFITILDYDEIAREYENREGPLKGLLIPVKDNISTRGILTTCGSRILSNYIPPFDAHVIHAIKRAGGIVVGKTNMDEFAMGNSGETSFYGPTKNPWDVDRVPGGSSSGSGVATSYGGMVSLGSDTGGSVRMPASYNYVLGLKPTYGLVSRYGLISYADSLEQIGPFARYSRDLALIYYYLTVYDDRDMTLSDELDRKVFRNKLLSIAHGKYEPEYDPSNIRVAYSPELVNLADEGVKRLFYDALEHFTAIGAKVVDVETELLMASLPSYYIIAMVEASSNLARYDGTNYGLVIEAASYWDSALKTRVEGFGEEVKRRLIMGGYASSKGYEDRYYLRALRVRHLIREYLKKLLDEFHFFILPTTPSPPPKFGEIVGPKGYVQDIYTVIPNLTGHPAINIPAGFVNNLPVGIQLIGRYFSEPDLIYMSMLLEGVIYDPRRWPG
jgi:aspartyl-tRNA(Asn)/glutamyl-tRNA(Gln) amidotransferase subunit A